MFCFGCPFVFGKPFEKVKLFGNGCLFFAKPLFGIPFGMFQGVNLF